MSITQKTCNYKTLNEIITDLAYEVAESAIDCRDARELNQMVEDMVSDFFTYQFPLTTIKFEK